MLDGFDKLAEGAGKALKNIPELYDDALKPSAQESGKLLARIPRAINAVFADLDKWILNKEYSIEETKKLLSYKLENISPEKIVTPEPYVAIPAIQAISYSMDSKELRNLYANLLAKSMNIDTKAYVHPSFVEIIKQMSPIDARILNEMPSNKTLPYVNLSSTEYDSEVKTINLNFISRRSFPYVTYIDFTDYETVNLSLGNLSRLGLTETRFAQQEPVPQKIKKSPHYNLCKTELETFLTNSKWRYEEQLLFLCLTSFGMGFYNVCIESFNPNML
ncbi:uncharacterized protein DUF4393 [Lacrimispora xylanisolvens]|uniref:Uncharacterized protein DUF4393 n=1 Tax=Lacrimispora xylanisolvens TaxID=384636 RepID=A0A2S6HJC8_9FIRM|nr:DUF4393 domain-containing protein [Hungatella xylanolytica]PPK77493.1 uncharacterized protein DUF4393 [Hungatella xylanolytica]